MRALVLLATLSSVLARPHHKERSASPIGLIVFNKAELEGDTQSPFSRDETEEGGLVADMTQAGTLIAKSFHRVYNWGSDIDKTVHDLVKRVEALESVNAMNELLPTVRDVETSFNERFQSLEADVAEHEEKLSVLEGVDGVAKGNAENIQTITATMTTHGEKIELVQKEALENFEKNAASIKDLQASLVETNNEVSELKKSAEEIQEQIDEHHSSLSSLRATQTTRLEEQENMDERVERLNNYMKEVANHINTVSETMENHLNGILSDVNRHQTEIEAITTDLEKVENLAATTGTLELEQRDIRQTLDQVSETTAKNRKKLDLVRRIVEEIGGALGVDNSQYKKMVAAVKKDA